MNSTSPSTEDISLLLSPKKARQAAAESAAWKYVNDRLTVLFSPNPIPRFERNDATLKALLELVKANDDADEERRLLYEAKTEALANLSEIRVDEKSVRRQLLRKLEQSLSKEGKEALLDLSASTTLLSCPSGRIGQMESRIVEVTSDTFEAENRLLSLQQTLRQFEREIKQIEQTVIKFRAETDKIDTEAMHSQTSAWNRETRVVSLKLGEYQDRIMTLSNYDAGPVRLEDIVQLEAMVGTKQGEIKKLEERILALHGLTPNLDVSRREVERARKELEEWKRRRERVFEGLFE